MEGNCYRLLIVVHERPKPFTTFERHCRRRNCTSQAVVEINIAL